MDVILFLMPLSCFNERMPENRRMSQLEDSINIWKKIVESKLLQNSTLIGKRLHSISSYHVLTDPSVPE